MRGRRRGFSGLPVLLVALVLAGCTASVAGRAVPAQTFREVPSSEVPGSGTSTSVPGTTGAEPASSRTVCVVLERDVPGTLEAVNSFVDAVTASPSSTLASSDPTVQDAVSSLGSTVSALDAAVAAAGVELSAELALDADRLARSLEQVSAAITEPDADTFNDGVDAVNDSYTDAESHCRFV